MKTPLRDIASAIAESSVMARPRKLWAQNQADWCLPLSKTQKGLIALYLVLSEYANGRFPPKFLNTEEVHANELRYGSSLPGVSEQEFAAAELRKPFWTDIASGYLRQFTFLYDTLRELGIRPPMRLLELGAGAGWMSEFLATMGFHVTATTISPREIALAKKRLEGLHARGVLADMQAVAAPMEDVHRALGGRADFDCAFVHEALHHAADWRQSLKSALACLKPGGWLVIANEPNRTHTVVSLRVGLLARTHEIGMSRPAIRRCLLEHGCSDVLTLKHRLDFWTLPIWLAAKKR